MDAGLLKQLNAERRARRAAILVTDLEGGADRLIREGDEVEGELGEAVARAFRSGRSVAVEADGRKLFLNAHLPSPRLVVIGAVHISQALAPMASLAGYPVEIVDPRTAFATAEGLRTEAQATLVRNHHLVSLVSGDTLRYQGPFASFGESILGS